MLSLHAGITIYVASHYADRRCGFSGLSRLVNAFGKEPTSGAFFVFFNKRSDRVKSLSGSGDGIEIGYKHLNAGRYRLPTVGEASYEMSHHDLNGLLAK